MLRNCFLELKEVSLTSFHDFSPDAANAVILWEKYFKVTTILFNLWSKHLFHEAVCLCFRCLRVRHRSNSSLLKVMLQSIST